jgi:hypothetical protein
MSYPKKRITEFVEFDEYDCRQVNLHLGRKWNYWFIEPNEKPIKLLKGELPEDLKNKDLGELKY